MPSSASATVRVSTDGLSRATGGEEGAAGLEPLGTMCARLRLIRRETRLACLPDNPTGMESPGTADWLMTPTASLIGGGSPGPQPAAWRVLFCPPSPRTEDKEPSCPLLDRDEMDA